MTRARATPRTYALLLSGDPGDLAALRALCELLPAAELPWRELSDPSQRVVAICNSALDTSVAEALAARGARVVAVSRSGHRAQLTAVGVPSREVLRWTAVREREAGSLPELLRPRPVSRDEPAGSALLKVRAEHPSALRTVQRLLALGRDDVTAQTVQSGDARWLMLRVPHPPMYLLLRARDEPEEGVAAYVGDGDDALWVRFGCAHPLPDIASKLLRRNGLCALVESDGAWQTHPRDLASEPLHALLAPNTRALSADLTPAAPPRFTVTLRLVPDAPRAAEAWLLDADALLRLEPLVESLSDDERARFSLSRLAGSDGPTYLLRERPRPGAAPLATRVSDLLGDPGFARAPVVPGLFLRVGARLTPPLRAEQLRAALDLDGASVTLLDLDADGMRIVRVRGEAEWSLADWVDLVATDRRAELDRLAETSVFDWLPELTVAPSPAPVAAPPTARPASASPRATAAKPVATAPAPDEAAPPAAPDAALTALRAMERERVRGPREDADAWARLGRRKLASGDDDDAAACLEAAVFHGGLRADTARALLAARTQRVAPQSLEAMSTHAPMGAQELARLGAASLARLADGDALDDATLLSLTRRFSAPDAPVSRWLAWSVLRAAHAARGDRVEVTRAKEALLGAVNARGLREDVDLPRFARGALADRDAPAHAGDAHLRAMDGLWAALSTDALQPGTPLDAYARVILAVGLHRLGAPSRAQDLAAPVRSALDTFAPANRALLRLYLARGASGGAPPRGSDELTDALRGDARARDRVEHLRARSEWLRGPVAPAAPQRLRPALARSLDALQGAPGLAAECLRAALASAGLYDFEVAAAVERCLDAAVTAGEEDPLREVLRAACERVDARMSSPASRARALGACVRAAAALGDSAWVASLVGAITALVDAPQAAHVADLLDAVTPSLRALRRLGAGDAGLRFFDALARAADRGGHGAIRLRVAAADGLLTLQHAERAEATLSRCLDEVLAPTLDPVERYQSARDLLATLRRLPVAQRAAYCERLARALDRFTDTFTASQAGLYETHKVLLLERLVDALGDELTPGGDALRALLDEEELALRRRIHADWSAACGP